MSFQDWWLHWDNTPVHAAASMVDFLVAKGVKTITHSPYSLDSHQRTFSSYLG